MPSGLPLADVKILDFMWVLAGASASRMLADAGATIIRVESARRFDTARTLAPFVNGTPGPENSALFHNTNAGKLMFSLDLSKPAGREVILDLVRWADVVTESFSPKAMKAWGFDYQSLRKVKPDVIMLSSCLMGQTGPLSQFAGYGNLAAAISGFFNLCGWPDRPPAGPFAAYTDYVAPRFTAISILAALDHKRRTGEGQYIDQSQSESALHFIAPALLDYTVNGRVQGGAGNRDERMAPHGVYPAKGDDRWVAIAVRTDGEWQALCEVMERTDLAGDPRLATAAGRLAATGALDEGVGAWSATREAEDVQTMLQARNVPAHVVATSPDALADPQLSHRGHFVTLGHPTMEKTTVEGPRFHLSRTPVGVRYDAPTLGRDNTHVLESILGYDEARITELVVDGVLE